MSEEITDLEKRILALILNNSQRPAAIARILRGRHVKCDQNQVVQALNSLEKKDLVERFTQKTWIAKSKAESLLEQE